tara:strand:+ start:281 stop:484 length:204 start_codon:yes stop_codon:yes gene_type:complete
MNTHDYFFHCVSVAREKGQTLFLDSDATCLVCRMSIGSHSLKEFEDCAFQYALSGPKKNQYMKGEEA